MESESTHGHPIFFVGEFFITTGEIEYGIGRGVTTCGVDLEEEKISALQASLELHYGVKGNHTLVESEAKSLEEEYTITPSPHKEKNLTQGYSYNYDFSIPFSYLDMTATFGEKVGIVEPTSVEIQNFEKVELLEENLHDSK